LIFVDMGVPRCMKVTQPSTVQTQKFNTMIGVAFEAELPMLGGDESGLLYGLTAPNALKYSERLKKNVRT